MTRLAILGYGAIGRSIVQRLQNLSEPRLTLVGALMRLPQIEGSRRSLPQSALATANIADLMALEPAVVVEAAGHTAVAAYGPEVLRRGSELMLLSVGALAHDALRERLLREASVGHGVITIPSGALAGFDGLLALREAGLRAVTYRSTKPPTAWRGTPAEEICDLTALRGSQVVFDGTAKDAALRFPRNANLAAAVALAGLGLERTRVQLVADAGTTMNTGELRAEGYHSSLEVRLVNTGFEANPKTSAITGLSVIAALTNRAATIRYQ